MTGPPVVTTATDVVRHLDQAIEAATVLGLDTTAAKTVATRLEARPFDAADPDVLEAAREALAGLGAAAGIDGPVKDLVVERYRRRAVDGSVSALAALLDMDGLERGAVMETFARASRLVAGPIGPLGAALERRARRDPGVVEPGVHLREWRGRGDLSGVTNLITGAVRNAVPAMAAPLRSGYGEAADVEELDGRLAASLDRMIASEEPETAQVPTSGLARGFTILLWVDAALVALTLAWTVASLTMGPEAPSLRIALFGLVSAPVLFLALSAVAGVLLVLGFRRHVDRLGRRWARRMEVVMRIGARIVVEGQAFNRVDRLESARLRLANAVRSVELPHQRIVTDEPVRSNTS